MAKHNNRNVTVVETNLVPHDSSVTVRHPDGTTPRVKLHEVLLDAEERSKVFKKAHEDLTAMEKSMEDKEVELKKEVEKVRDDRARAGHKMSDQEKIVEYNNSKHPNDKPNLTDQEKVDSWNKQQHTTYHDPKPINQLNNPSHEGSAPGHLVKTIN